MAGSFQGLPYFILEISENSECSENLEDLGISECSEDSEILENSDFLSVLF